MNGAQAAGCSPVASAFEAGQDVVPARSSRDTIAKSLAIGNPADGPYALDLARRTGGSVDAVSDEEIKAGISAARRDDGRLHRDGRRRHDRRARRSSPSAGDIDPDERVVLVITGEGLKTLDAVRGTLRDAHDRADGRGLRGARAPSR